MPKKKSALIAGVAPLPEEGFLREAYNPLTLEERQELRTIFSSPLWRKVWHNAQLGSPPSLVPGLDTALGGVIANNQIHRKQGWELFSAALASQVVEKVQRAPRPADSYDKPLEIQPGR